MIITSNQQKKFTDRTRFTMQNNELNDRQSNSYRTFVLIKYISMRCARFIGNIFDVCDTTNEYDQRCVHYDDPQITEAFVRIANALFDS